MTVLASFADFAAAGHASFARDAAAWARNGAGVWLPSSPDEIRRIDGVGLLLEPERTNRLRNSSGAGATIGAPGGQPTNWSGFMATLNGLAREVVAVGTDTATGLPFCDIRYAGTTNTSGSINPSFETNTGVPAAQNETLAVSAYLALVGGSLAGLTSITWRAAVRASGGGYLGELVADGVALLDALNGTPTRFALIATISNPSAAHLTPYIQFAHGNGAAVDFTLRIIAPQVELGTWASSPVLTSDGPVTRPADELTLHLPSGVYDLIVTFDDDSTQRVGAISGDHVVSVALDRQVIKSLVVGPPA